MKLICGMCYSHEHIGLRSNTMTTKSYDLKSCYCNNCHVYTSRNSKYYKYMEKIMLKDDKMRRFFHDLGIKADEKDVSRYQINKKEGDSKSYRDIVH